MVTKTRTDMLCGDLIRSLEVIFMMADGATDYSGSAGARLKGCLDEATEALTKARAALKS